MDKSIFLLLTQMLPEMVNKQNLYKKTEDFTIKILLSDSNVSDVFKLNSGRVY